MSIVQTGPDQTLGPQAAALWYAAHGWRVLPCRADSPRCRDPRCHRCKAPLTEHGLLDASTDPAQIRAWWRRWPAANVALATGAPGPDVLDVDQHGDAGNGFAAFNRLKRAGMLAGATALVRTTSGGLHVYFTGTAQGCGKLPRHHLDFKATGGYVLAPPSRVHGRPYELLDHRAGTGRLDWAAACRLLTPPRSRPALGRPPGGQASTGRLAAWVARQPESEHNRNNALFWAACRAAEADDLAALDAIAAAGVAAGLSDAEAHKAVSSAVRTVTR